MSKLYNEYLKQKNQNNEKLYLFKSGIFYIALDKDAIKLSEIFSFKLTNLNENVVKCGFPEKRLEYYCNLLNSKKICFQIIDFNYSKIFNYSDYLNNVKIKNIIDSVCNIDMNNISFREAFDFLNKIQRDLKQIYDL